MTAQLNCFDPRRESPSLESITRKPYQTLDGVIREGLGSGKLGESGEIAAQIIGVIEFQEGIAGRRRPMREAGGAKEDVKLGGRKPTQENCPSRKIAFRALTHIASQCFSENAVIFFVRHLWSNSRLLELCIPGNALGCTSRNEQRRFDHRALSGSQNLPTRSFLLRNSVRVLSIHSITPILKTSASHWRELLTCSTYL